MEAISSETHCTHCDRGIPTGNYELHYAHCTRNLRKCSLCNHMVPLQSHGSQDHHFTTVHAPVSCSLCNSVSMEAHLLPLHMAQHCPLRILTCPFCDFPLPASDLPQHQDLCGNRTQLCHLCNNYVRLCQLDNHPLTCNNPVAPRHTSIEEAPQREEPLAPRRTRQPPSPPRSFSPRKLLVTLAITGMAVLIGSLFFQRKSPSPSPSQTQTQSNQPPT